MKTSLSPPPSFSSMVLSCAIYTSPLKKKNSVPFSVVWRVYRLLPVFSLLPVCFVFACPPCSVLFFSACLPVRLSASPLVCTCAFVFCAHFLCLFARLLAVFFVFLFVCSPCLCSACAINICLIVSWGQSMPVSLSNLAFCVGSNSSCSNATSLDTTSTSVSDELSTSGPWQSFLKFGGMLFLALVGTCAIW